jgi:hypothetical protein
MLPNGHMWVAVAVELMCAATCGSEDGSRVQTSACQQHALRLG